MGKDKGDKSRSRSPIRSGSTVSGSTGSGSSSERPPPAGQFSREDLMQMMSEAMTAQFPRMVVETSKVVTAQLQADNQDHARSFTAFSQDMKQLKLRTEEVEAKAKTAALKSEGGYGCRKNCLIHLFLSALTFLF